MSRALQYIKFIVIFIFALRHSSADLFYIISTIVHFDRLYVEDFQVNISADHLSVNVAYNLARDQPSNPWYDVIIDIKNRRSQKYRRLLRTKPIDLCALIKQTDWFRHTIISMMESGGVNLNKCPLKKANFTWTNVTSKNLRLPGFMAAKYRTTILSSFQNGKIVASNFTVFYEVK